MSANGKPEAYRLGFLTALEVADRGYVGGLLITNHFGRPLEFQCTLPIKPNATQEILYGPTLESFLMGELIATTLIEKSGIKPHLVLTDCEQILAVREHVTSPVALVPTDRMLRDKGSRSTPVPRQSPPAPHMAISPSAQMDGNAPSSAGEAAAGLLDSPAIPESTSPGSTSPLSTSPGIPEPDTQTTTVELHAAESMPLPEVARTLKLGRQIIRFHPAHPDDRDRVASEARLIASDSDLREPFDRVREALQETLRNGGLR